MWWINSICSIVSLLVVLSSFFCYGRIMINKERIRLGFEPKYNPKKLSLWSNISFIVAIISLAVIIINSVIIILNE
jgi:hypothetical protein